MAEAPDLKRAKTSESRRLQHERIGEATLKRTRAYGKLILFGEHFVVYKVPALVAAVSAYTDCECAFTEAPGLEVVDDRPAVAGYKKEKKAEADEAIAIVLRHFGLDPAKRGMKLTFGGELCAVSGIGASAAQVVALARAIGLALPKELSEDDVNAAGYEGEKGYHGTPSGIDNTAATFGGVLRFQRTEGAPKFTMKKIKTPIRIVYASTGITASTSKVRRSTARAARPPRRLHGTAAGRRPIPTPPPRARALADPRPAPRCTGRWSRTCAPRRRRTPRGSMRC